MFNVLFYTLHTIVFLIFYHSISHTTYSLPQKIDEDETDDYYYVTEDEFEAMRFKAFNLFYYLCWDIY